MLTWDCSYSSIQHIIIMVLINSEEERTHCMQVLNKEKLKSQDALQASVRENEVAATSVSHLHQGIIVLTRTETWQLFSRMFITLNKFKELFYSN